MTERPRGVYTPVQRKGFDIAARDGAVKPGLTGGVFEVFSDGELAIVAYERETCTRARCRRVMPKMKCADWWAVAYTIQPPTPDEFKMPTAEVKPSIVLPEKTKIITATDLEEAKQLVNPRGGYKRFAAAYDKVLRNELTRTIPFAMDICRAASDVLVWRKQSIRGKKQYPLANVLFGALMYTYLGFSLRGTEDLLRLFSSVGLITGAFPEFALLSEFLRSAEATPLLHAVLALTAEPFREFGSIVFAGDGTGNAANNNKFFDYRMQATEGKEQLRPHAIWYRVHIVAGVDTMQIVLMRVTRGGVEKELDEKTVMKEQLIPALSALDYDIDQFLADGGLNDGRIREDVVEKLHAIPLIPWSSTSKNAISHRLRKVVGNVELMNALHKMCTEDDGKRFREAGFNYRVKIECLISSLKERTSGYVRTYEGNGPENEILLKGIVSNIHFLLLAAEAYGLDVAALNKIAFAA